MHNPVPHRNQMIRRSVFGKRREQGRERRLVIGQISHLLHDQAAARVAHSHAFAVAADAIHIHRQDERLARPRPMQTGLEAG